ncbi:MAG: hypothetical protein M1828_000897 [Chrysothrix sp. TS-e1954]|nr:MAG: hypothetical protein M1828_000897 [Chrysothrix sp. TS-e1954]
MFSGIATLPASDPTHGAPLRPSAPALLPEDTHEDDQTDTLRFSLSSESPPTRTETRPRITTRRPVRSQEQSPERNGRRGSGRQPLLRVALGRSTTRRSRRASAAAIPQTMGEEESSSYADRVLAMSRTRSATTTNDSSTTSPYIPHEPFSAFLDPSNSLISRQPPLETQSTPRQTGREASDSITSSVSHLPSIHFVPAQEPIRGRPSLDFSRITRILPSNRSIIRVGRYSERDTSSDSNSRTPSDAPIGFKSKVVSRRHCEFTFEGNQWFIKDVKSSSGTFLNHIRLSQPGTESRPFPVNDGDIVQLGIDFKGGEEMIFRCVKIRVETNRGWQKAVNKFKYVSPGCEITGKAFQANMIHSKSTHQHLQRLAKQAATQDSDAASKHSTECTICLNSIAVGPENASIHTLSLFSANPSQPCQALFVAPCSHTWHYRCIRKMLNDPNRSQFLCPNCRAQADLDADIEEPELEYLEDDDDDFVDALNDSVASTAQRQESSAADGRPLSNEAIPSIGRIMSSGTEPDSDDRMIDDASNNLGFISLSPTRQLEPFSTPTATISTSNTQSSSTTPTTPRSHLSPPPPSHGLDPTASAFVPGGAANRPDNRQTLTAALPISNDPSGPWQPESSVRTPPDASGAVREGMMTPRNNAGPFVFDGSAAGQNEGGSRDRTASSNGAAAAG